MRAWLSLGSNLENPAIQVQKALSYLQEKCYITILSASDAIETKPFGFLDQPDFINQIIEIETPMTAVELLIFLKNAEKHLGRVPAERWRPRIIDLDILFYGDEIIQTEELTIPHPAIQEREYLLRLLNDMIPEYIHPVLNEKICQIYEKFGKTGGIQ